MLTAAKCSSSWCSCSDLRVCMWAGTDRRTTHQIRVFSCLCCAWRLAGRLQSGKQRAEPAGASLPDTPLFVFSINTDRGCQQLQQGAATAHRCALCTNNVRSCGVHGPGVKRQLGGAQQLQLLRLATTAAHLALSHRCCCFPGELGGCCIQVCQPAGKGSWQDGQRQNRHL